MGSFFRFCQGFFRIGKQKPGMAVDNFPCRSKLQSLTGARKKGQAQMLFQDIDLLHHRRGRQIKLFCCFMKTAAVCGTDKGGKLTVKQNGNLPGKRVNQKLIRYYNIDSSVSTFLAVK